MMTTDAVLAAAKDLPIDDLRRLARELADHKAATEARAAATAVLERWPDAATLKLTYAAYDSGVFLEPVAVADADGRIICADAELIAAVCDSELTEISRGAHEPGHRPYLDLATAELRFDGSGPADLAAAFVAATSTTEREAVDDTAAAPALRAELDGVTLATLVVAAERAAATVGHAFTDETLDEDVHDAASERGTTVNNGGVEAQVRYLSEQLGVNHVRVLLLSLGVTIRGGQPSATRDAERSAGVIGYDRWEDFAATLTVRARVDSDSAGVDVDRVPDERRAAIVASWTFGPFHQAAPDADAWWTTVGGPWFDGLQNTLIADGYGLRG